MIINNVIFSLFSLLMFILAIPGTLALRNVLAGSLLVILLFIFIKNKHHKSLFELSEFQKVSNPLIVLTLFILLHSVFVSSEPAWSLSEFKSHWVYPMLYFLIGLLLSFYAYAIQFFSKEKIVNTIFFVLFLHILLLDLFAASAMFKGAELSFMRYGGLLESPASANYLTNILASILVVESLYRLRLNKKVLKVSNWVLSLLVILVVISYIFEGIRIGFICLFFIGLGWIYFYFLGNKKMSLKKIAFTIPIFVLIFCLPLASNIKNDARWSSIIKTIPLVMDTDSNSYWQNSKNKTIVPKFKDGKVSSESNYLRMTWILKGFEYIKINPIGIGFGRNSFGHAIQIYEKNDNVRGYHSHSSIIDLTIGIGILGSLIWFFFIFRVLHISYKKASKDFDYYALLTIFLTSIFFIRSIVDSNMRDHIFQNFMLILGITFSLMLYGKEKKNS